MDIQCWWFNPALRIINSDIIYFRQYGAKCLKLSILRFTFTIMHYWKPYCKQLTFDGQCNPLLDTNIKFVQRLQILQGRRRIYHHSWVSYCNPVEIWAPQNNHQKGKMAGTRSVRKAIFFWQKVGNTSLVLINSCFLQLSLKSDLPLKG